MDIKSGDKIKVRHDLKIGKYYGQLEWLPVMEYYLKGRIFTVLEVCDNDNILIQTNFLDNAKFYLTSEMIMPHTKYEQIQQMTIEEMAKRNIYIVDTSWTTAYITSDGCLFDIDHYDKAFQHEMDWLNSDSAT